MEQLGAGACAHERHVDVVPPVPLDAAAILDSFSALKDRAVDVATKTLARASPDSAFARDERQKQKQRDAGEAADVGWDGTRWDGMRWMRYMGAVTEHTHVSFIPR